MTRAGSGPTNNDGTIATDNHSNIGAASSHRWLKTTLTIGAESMLIRMRLIAST
jgi:hypothetical protein